MELGENMRHNWGLRSGPGHANMQACHFAIITLCLATHALNVINPTPTHLGPILELFVLDKFVGCWGQSCRAANQVSRPSAHVVPPPAQ